MQYLCLRGVHIEMTFQETIGDHMPGSELELIWIEAGITTRGIANKVMNGKDYKTGMRLHKLTWQAGLMIIIHQFLNYMKTSDLHQTIISLSSRNDSVNQLTDVVMSEAFRHEFVAYMELKCEHKTFGVFVTYLNMVQVILPFNKAQLNGNWDLYYQYFLIVFYYFSR